MTSYIGSWAIDDILTFYVNTQRFDTGAATDADAVPSYRVYENEAYMSAPAITGNMSLLDSANTAGFYSEQLTLSASNGYEVGKAYSIYIAATVGGVTGATHRTFQICAAVNSKLVDGAAPDDTDTIVNAIYDEATAGHVTAGTFGVLLTGDSTNTTAIKAKTDQLTFGTTNRVNAQVYGTEAAISIASVTGAVGSVTGNVGGNVVGSVASVTGAVGSVTGNIGGNVAGSVGSVTGAVGSVTGAVGSVATNGITAASLAADVTTELQTGLATAAAVAALPTASANADALLDRTDGIETSLTFRQFCRLAASVLFGKATGLDGTPIVFRDVNDTKARVTVAQSASARTTVTKDAT